MEWNGGGEGVFNTPNFGTKKNLVLKDPKFRTNKNFLKCFTNDGVFFLFALFDLVLLNVLTCVTYLRGKNIKLFLLPF